MARPPRCTCRTPQGAAELCEGIGPDQALERLAAYEDLADFLHGRLKELDEQIEALRAAGKVKTVTYRQLTGTRMALREMLEHYEDRGL